MLHKLLLIPLISLTLIACGGAMTRPGWIDDPGDGVTGAAGTHVKGRYFQEELAISRARAEWAKSLGAKVDVNQVGKTVVSNERVSSYSAQEIAIQVNGQEVKARVKEKWRDPGSDTLWIWLVPND